MPVQWMPWSRNNCCDALRMRSRVPLPRQMNGVIMGKLDGKVAMITGATSGMALAGAKLFVDEGAHVFISGRRQDAVDEAVK